MYIHIFILTIIATTNHKRTNLWNGKTLEKKTLRRTNTYTVHQPLDKVERYTNIIHFYQNLRIVILRSFIDYLFSILIETMKLRNHETMKPRTQTNQNKIL